jgi:hypothetical protein
MILIVAVALLGELAYLVSTFDRHRHDSVREYKRSVESLRQIVEELRPR